MITCPLFRNVVSCQAISSISRAMGGSPDAPSTLDRPAAGSLRAGTGVLMVVVTTLCYANDMKKSELQTGASPSQLIDARIEELGDWRGATLARIRALIKQADPTIVEEWKWSVPVWSLDGLICTGEAYKNVVKMTFAKGASLKDPSGLFNSSLEGNVRRAIDFHQNDKMNETALKALIRAAVKLNRSKNS